MATTTTISEADKTDTTTTAAASAAAAEPSRAHGNNDDDPTNASEKAEAPLGGGDVNNDKSSSSSNNNNNDDGAITKHQGDAAASTSTSTRTTTTTTTTTRTSPRFRKAAKAPPPTPTSERKRKRKNASVGTVAIGTASAAATVTKSKKRRKLSKKNSNAKNINDKTAEDDVEIKNNNQASTVVNDNDDNDDDDDDDDGPKADGRKNNKGAAKRESYSVAFKAKALRDFEEWEKEQHSQGNHTPTVRHYCLTRGYGNKYIKFLSATNGWRAPGVRERILQDAGIGDYKDLARMTDRTKNKSYYAEMEEALLKRLQEYRERNISVSNKTIRQLAKEELRKLTNDEEKVNAFKASNGWVYNFLKRQERKEKDMQRKAKHTQPTKHINNNKQNANRKEQDVGDANTNPNVDQHKRNLDDEDDDNDQNDKIPDADPLVHKNDGALQ